MPKGELAATGIEIDLEANTLHLNVVAKPMPGAVQVDAGQPGSIDIGVGGRLLGIEVGGVYLPVMDAETGAGSMVRTAEIGVDVVRDRISGAIVSIVVPRRGAGYEITWPSGNQ